MSQRCPVCRTPLWKEPLISRRLRCPRCGAEFRPTVPWAYFQFLVIVVALLALTVLFALSGPSFWSILLIVLLLIVLFWNLPKLINLEQIPGDLSVAEGPTPGDDVQMKMDYGWKNGEEDTDPDSTRLLFPFLISLLIALLVILAIKVLT